MRQAPPASPAPPRGILHRHTAVDVVHDRRLPAEDLAPFVAHLWSVRWNLADPIEVETLSHPAVHLVVEVDHDDGSVRGEVAGPHLRKFARHLKGRGQVFGVKFRPAMFRRWWHGSVAELVDAPRPLHDVGGGLDVEALVAVTAAATPFVDQLDAVSAILRAAMPPLLADDVQLRDLVETMADDPTIVGVDDLVAISGLSARTLQRRFKDVLGVSPKWVLQRYRLHEAAMRLRQPNPPPLADLAATLGYADQAHFARDFRATIGVPPGRFTG